MTRHARNCTAGAVYTYYEKKKDARSSGYGTETQRLGKDSVKDFDCCCLTLQPCRNPVVTRDGYLFDKEAILEYTIVKKNEISRQLKEYEKQKKKEETELAELAVAEKRSKIVHFLKNEQTIASSQPSTSGAVNNSISNMANGKDKQLPSFWLPSQTPDAKTRKLEKPDTTVYCPMSGKPLKIKGLIDVKFKEIKDSSDKTKLIAKKERYECAVTGDVLSNSIPVAVLATTGDVVTMECVEKIIKKNMIHPLTNEKLKEKDIIPLQRGGTGYAQTNNSLKVENHRPVLQA
ncbi:nitric oxide synthase-interacting protein homolog [Planococcus citri]|uniref:nitric oxide synthase-interacting protein homolog n=1 Tax=Planococcus citri TaxID=170843 RepID=UPI0031F8BF71